MPVCCLPHSYAEILTPSVRVLGGEASGRPLCNKSGGLMKLLKKLQTALWPLLPCEDMAGRQMSVNQEGPLTKRPNLPGP